MSGVQEKMHHVAKKASAKGKQASQAEYTFGLVVAALAVVVFFVDSGSRDLTSSAGVFEHLRRYAFEIGIMVVCVVLPILVSHIGRLKSASGGDDVSRVPVKEGESMLQKRPAHGGNQ